MQPGPPRTSSRERNNPQRVRSLQREGTHARGDHTPTRLRTQPGFWRCRNRNRHGQVHTSELTLTRAIRCRGRGHTRADTHGDANARAAGCLGMPCLSAFSMKINLSNFSCPRQGPPLIIGPLHAANCLVYVLFIYVFFRAGGADTKIAPSRFSLRKRKGTASPGTRLRAPPPPAADGPGEG